MITSSPTSSIRLRPCSSQASTAQPSARHCSSPSYTGSSGQPADEGRAHVGAAAGREQPHVGADVLIHPAEALGRERRARSSRSPAARARSWSRPGSHAGLLAAREQARADAHAGDPCALGELPQDAEVGVPGAAVVEHDRGLAVQAPTRKFHIIQPVVVNQNMRSPGRRSRCRRFFSCSSRIPPWPCTIAFGSPVVPEE